MESWVLRSRGLAGTGVDIGEYSITVDGLVYKSRNGTASCVLDERQRKFFPRNHISCDGYLFSVKGIMRSDPLI
jgi:hypothetical protein